MKAEEWSGSLVGKHHRMDGNAIRRPHENCSRSGAMEDHDSEPSQRRRHMMMLIQSCILDIPEERNI